ncbi:hypothetical protein GYMLUDRAFT_296633 [Collybiopsis luxurians FD-317 M1]|nr:hypothetical protein GYMLUDRAFT_296633 [Collybiopsis luxurians FD-317 M1]
MKTLELSTDQLAFSNLKLALMDPQSTGKEKNSIIDYISNLLRPYSPNLASLFVFLLLIPFIAFLSLSAGFIVWRNIAVGWHIPLYLQYGDGVPPYAHALLSDLSSRQPYNVVLQLVVPSTQSNFALGNFMSSLTISTVSNKTLASVRRPAITIPPKFSFFKTNPHLVTIDIPMLDSFVPGTRQLAVDIVIGRQDIWKSIGSGEGRELSVFSASLKGILAHKGIRGLVTRFPTFFSVLCSAIFFAILFLILAAFLLPSILQSTSTAQEDTSLALPDENEQKPIIEERYQEEPSDTESDASGKEEKPSKSARRRKRRSKNKNTSEVSNLL